MYKRSRHNPILPATKEFFSKDTEACVKCNYSNQTWYHGTGVYPSQHPLKNLLKRFKEDVKCGKCKSKAVKVIAMQYCVHPMSGDLYFDSEFICDECNYFTAISYSE
jgi:hypothetical protein